MDEKEKTKTFEEYVAYMKLLEESFPDKGETRYVKPELIQWKDVQDEEKQPLVKIRKFSNKDLVKVEALAIVFTLEQVGTYFGLTSLEFNLSMCEDRRILEAYNRGSSYGIKVVSKALLVNAIEDKNTTAQMFYLKHKGRWKEAVDETDNTMRNLLAFLDELPVEKCTPQELSVMIKSRARAQGLSV